MAKRAIWREVIAINFRADARLCTQKILIPKLKLQRRLRSICPVMDSVWVAA